MEILNREKIAHPLTVDLENKLQGCFGCVEFEDFAIRVINFLSKSQSDKIGEWWDRGHGWNMQFSLDEISKDNPTRFAMFCAAGWLQNSWFPKGAFRVSDEFIQRLVEKGKLKTL